MRRTLVIASVLAAATLPARAAIVPIGPEFIANTYTTGLQVANGRSVCRTPNGDFVVAWRSSGQDGSGYGVFGRRWSSAGSPLGAEFRVNSYTTGSQSRARVACGGAGELVVVWQSTNGHDEAAYGLVGQRFASGGEPAGTEFAVNTYTTGLQEAPVMAFDGGGGFVVVWQSQGQDGDGFGVFGQRFAASGDRLDGEFRVNAYTTGDQRTPAVADLGANGFIVLYSDVNDGSGPGIAGQRFASAGGVLGPPFQVNTYTTEFQITPALAAEANGDFVAVWSSRSQDGNGHGVFGRRFTSAGDGVGTEFQVNTHTTAYQQYPAVCSDADGGFVVAWEGNLQDGDQHGVFGQRYDASGAPHGTEFQVNTYTTGRQGGEVSLACDGDGDFVVTWTGINTNQDGAGHAVLARVFQDPCGDGTVGAGEECDVGDRRPSGGCCSPACRFIAAGTPCPSDGVDCTVDACDAAGTCAHAPAGPCPTCRVCDVTAGCVARPRTDCRRPTRANGASLELTRGPRAKGHRLAFQWKKGAATTVADFGNPVAAGDHTLCLFDAQGGADRLVLESTAPAGKGWKAVGSKGFRYRSRSGTPNGLRNVTLRSGAAGKAQVLVGGKGASLGLPAPALALDPPVTAQLEAAGGACFAASFATARKNTATRFRAKGR